MIRARMVKARRGGWAALLAASLVLAGCATTGLDPDDPSLSPAERRMALQARDYNQTVATSAAVGCAAGLGTARATGATGGGLGWGDLIACGIGAAAGWAAGDYVADKKNKYQDENVAIRSMIADAQKENRQLAEAITSADQVIAADTQKIDQVKQRLAQGQITAQQAESELASVDRNAKFLRDQIEGMKKRETQWRSVASEVAADNPEGAQAIEAEAEKLRQQIGYLEQEVDSLVERRIVSRV